MYDRVKQTIYALDTLTRQIIRCQITVTLRRTQTKQDIVSNEGGGVTKPTGHHIILTKNGVVHPTAVSEIYSCTKINVYLKQCMTIIQSISTGTPGWRRSSGFDCGSEDLSSILGIPSPRVGPLIPRGLKTSLGVPVPVLGRLGTLTTPSCPWLWVPGSRSKFLETGQLPRHHVGHTHKALAEG